MTRHIGTLEGIHARAGSMSVVDTDTGVVIALDSDLAGLPSFRLVMSNDEAWLLKQCIHRAVKRSQKRGRENVEG